jgi:hypothetical protein
MGDMGEIQDSHEMVVDEVTALGDADDNWAKVGSRKYEGKLLGIYSNGGVLTAFDATAVQQLMYALEGNTVGKEFTGIDTLRAEVTRAAERDKLHRVEASFKAQTAMDKGLVSAHHASKSQSGESAAVDNAASSANGAAGYLGVSALTLGGYTSVTIKIRHSTDNITYADLIAFANVTAAPASERKTAAGTVNRYTKTTVTFNGAGAAESVKFATGLARL